MFKKLRYGIFGGENEISNKKSDFIYIPKNTMSYTRERTGFAGHDKKLSRIQGEKGYINDATYFQTTKLDYRIFDSNVLEKMYPNCSKEQLRGLKILVLI